MSSTLLKDFPYISRWESTGNICIDAVSHAVTHHRAKRMPLNRILVSDYYWRKGLHWFEQQRKTKRISDEQFMMIEQEGLFMFDSVEIKKSELLTASKPMMFEYYQEQTKPE